jgi:hypothetical protein
MLDGDEKTNKSDKLFRSKWNARMIAAAMASLIIRRQGNGNIRNKTPPKKWQVSALLLPPSVWLYGGGWWIELQSGQTAMRLDYIKAAIVAGQGLHQLVYTGQPGSWLYIGRHAKPTQLRDGRRKWAGGCWTLLGRERARERRKKLDREEYKMPPPLAYVQKGLSRSHISSKLGKPLPP